MATEGSFCTGQAELDAGQRQQLTEENKILADEIARLREQAPRRTMCPLRRQRACKPLATHIPLSSTIFAPRSCSIAQLSRHRGQVSVPTWPRGGRRLQPADRWRRCTRQASSGLPRHLSTCPRAMRRHIILTSHSCPKAR